MTADNGIERFIRDSKLISLCSEACREWGGSAYLAREFVRDEASDEILGERISIRRSASLPEASVSTQLNIQLVNVDLLNTTPNLIRVGNRVVVESVDRNTDGWENDLRQILKSSIQDPITETVSEY